MVEQVVFQTVFQFLQTVGILVGVFYYIMTLRNTRKNQQLQLETRQAQLFTSLSREFRSVENFRTFGRAVTLEWDDYDDFEARYGPGGNLDERAYFSSIGNFFEEVGVLVEEGLIDMNLVEQLVGGNLRMIWERYEPMILEARKRRNYPQYYDKMEYLYNEMKKRRGHQWQ